MDEYRYLLSVGTGHRRGASTSSQVNAQPCRKKLALKPFLQSGPSIGFHVSYEIWLTGLSVYTDVQTLCGYLCAQETSVRLGNGSEKGEVSQHVSALPA